MYRVIAFLATGILILAPAASATLYHLNSSTMDQFGNGIHYNGTEPLTLSIDDAFVISSHDNVAIESTAPLAIVSPGNRTLTILVDNNEDVLYGVKAPSILLENGRLDIRISGSNDGEKGNAYGLYAGSGNVTVSGGFVDASVSTTGHKNKGLYASQFIIVSGGRVSVKPYGGHNTFGLDGGNIEKEGMGGGIIITGGTILVNASNGTTRNIGIDSKFGTVRISGNPFICIYEDGSGSQQNFAYNPNITTISGGNAVVFTSSGEQYILCDDAVLAQNATLIPGKTFEILAGQNLTVSDGYYLVRPADTTLKSGEGYGTLEYDHTLPTGDGGTVFAGNENALRAPFPLAGMLAGLGAVLLLGKKKPL